MNKSEINSNAMAATSHPLATEEALKIMKKGGNAVDAALAASIVLSVVEPNATSIGGDCFAIIKMEGKEPIAYNGSGISPEKANYEFFKKNNIDKIGLTSPHSVTVPGAINAWKQIHNDFGKLDFEELLDYWETYLIFLCIFFLLLEDTQMIYKNLQDYFYKPYRWG